MQVIDTHTGGEPTRVVVHGGPDLGAGTPAQIRERFRSHGDAFRSAVVNEPRGSDVMVGALLLPATRPDCAAGVVFFNNVGCLNMCGHGTIGVVVALAHLGRIDLGKGQLETPVGVVGYELAPGHRVTIENVESYRFQKQAIVEPPGLGPISGDVVWGGNWFFLTAHRPAELTLPNVDVLTDHAWRIREALTAQGIAGEEGAEIDHIELLGPPADPANHGRSFVLCPGKAYDRSPCGTGTSAKLACLHADGLLREGDVWRQESVVGSVFEGRFRDVGNGRVIPRITGTAWVNGEATLLLDERDPFCWGIRPQ
ncbi:MAG: proline racemase family protein [Planctomyces sp.]|nr:proline racemase family protein [Planctomyces sp.]